MEPLVSGRKDECLQRNQAQSGDQSSSGQMSKHAMESVVTAIYQQGLTRSC